MPQPVLAELIGPDMLIVLLVVLVGAAINVILSPTFNDSRRQPLLCRP